MNTIRHLFLDQVMPLILSHRGEVVLHASAVAGPRGAIVFAGDSGCGKSTLAASFYEQGLALLTDDCFLLRESNAEFLVVPSYPGLRLWDDSVAGLNWQAAELVTVSHYSEKKRLLTGNGRSAAAAELVPLSRLYLLAPPDAQTQAGPLAISPVRPQDALIELVRRAYCLDITDRNRIRSHFEMLGRIAAGAPIFQLSFPHDYALLREVREAILRNGEAS